MLTIKTLNTTNHRLALSILVEYYHELVKTVNFKSAITAFHHTIYPIESQENIVYDHWQAVNP